MRVNVTIDDKLLERVDEFCERNRFKRSGLVAVALRDYMDAKEAAPQLKELLGTFLKSSGAVVQGEISHEEYDRQTKVTQEEIEQLRLKLDL